MQLTPQPLSSTSIQLTWAPDVGDTPQDSVTIYEAGPNNQKQNQPGLSWLGGSTFFANLSPGTPYQFQMVGFLETDAGVTTLLLATVSASTLKKGAHSVPPAGAPQPPTNSTYPGAVANLQSEALPFGKIVVSWNQTGDWAETLTVQRWQVNGSYAVVYSVQNYGQPPGNTGVPTERDSFTDLGPFAFNAKYNYWFFSNNGQQSAIVPVPNLVIYPEYFALNNYLPPGFDATQGVKRLRPNDHPYVSVRAIMTGSA
jgi:hypothetical protein